MERQLESQTYKYRNRKRNKDEMLQSTKEERFLAIYKTHAMSSQLSFTVGTTHIPKLTADQLIKEIIVVLSAFTGCFVEI